MWGVKDLVDGIGKVAIKLGIKGINVANDVRKERNIREHGEDKQKVKQAEAVQELQEAALLIKDAVQKLEPEVQKEMANVTVAKATKKAPKKKLFGCIVVIVFISLSACTRKIYVTPQLSQAIYLNQDTLDVIKADVAAIEALLINNLIYKCIYDKEGFKEELKKYEKIGVDPVVIKRLKECIK
jgi:hypothetical protein